MIKRTLLHERIDQWVDEHRDEMIEDLKALVRIPSVKGEALSGMPYGAECAKAVGHMQELMDRYGFRTTNYENHCVACDLDGRGEKKLDILAHLDVVPVSEDWKKTAPFEPLVEGDCIYGRGTQDDKGPAVAALYAMRCIRELGINLESGVRLLCGSDEESGSSDLAYYYSKEEEPDYTFSPDAEYPLINIEKGRLAKEFQAQGHLNIPIVSSSGRQAGSDSDSIKSSVRVLGIDVGDIFNVIPGKGTLHLAGVTEANLTAAAEAVRKKADCSFSWTCTGDKMTVHVIGTTGHAAFPESSVNCTTLILEFLKHLPLADDSGEKMLLQIGRLWPHGEHSGASLGVDYSDRESGSLTMSLDVLKYEVSKDGKEYTLSGVFDCRAPICCNDENLTEKVKSCLTDGGFVMEDGPMVPAHYVSEDSELVRKLLESYELYFGKKGEAQMTGGGTYVHDLKHGVAFGCEVSGVDNRIHGDDEYAQISVLVKSAKIFADAIIRLCG